MNAETASTSTLWIGKHRNSRRTVTSGFLVTPPTNAAVVAQTEKAGSTPMSTDIPNPIDIPANITGKK